MIQLTISKIKPNILNNKAQIIENKDNKVLKDLLQKVFNKNQR